MQEKRTDELDELLETMKPEQLGDYYKDNKKYMADDKKTFSYYMKDVLANKNLMCANRKICLKDIYSIAGVSESYGEKILNMEKHTKNRDLILRFCIAGHFLLDEVNRALKLYGMNPLYAKDKRDACFIVAINNRKYELFEIDENILKVVSLDGHRISIRKTELTKNYQSRKVVVPGKTLNEISKILSGEVEDQVKIFFTDNHIVFEFDDTVVVSRLIEGEYFRIDQMLSSDYETKVKINKREFLDCIDRATLFVKEGDKKPIIITIDDTGMQLNINSQMGSMNEEIDIDKEGKDIMIGFNPKFLIDALKVIDDEEISIYLVNPKAPCFIKNEEESYIYLILPVNFNTAR